MSTILPEPWWFGSCFLVNISFCGVTQLISYWVTSRCPFSPAAGILFCFFCPSRDLIPRQLSSVIEFLHVLYLTVTGNPSCKLLLDTTSSAGNFYWMLILSLLSYYLTFFWSPASLLLWKIIWIFDLIENICWQSSTYDFTAFFRCSLSPSLAHHNLRPVFTNLIFK